MGIRKRIVKRFRRIANEKGITYAELLKAYKSQFKFAKEKIEELEPIEIEEMTEEELEEYVFNFIYIGKIHTNKRLVENGKKKREKRESKRA